MPARCAGDASDMFGSLQILPPDPILGVPAAFRRDTDPNKVDLGVGVYRGEYGNTPVPDAVRLAEQAMLAEQTTKVYVGPAGNLDFNERIVALALGPGFLDGLLELPRQEPRAETVADGLWVLRAVVVTEPVLDRLFRARRGPTVTPTAQAL